jgi:hypothetical protein
VRRSEVEKIQTHQVASQVLGSAEQLMALLIDDDKDPSKRKLLPTQREYMTSKAKLKAYMGPAGCAKSTTGCADIMLRALMIPGSKWFIARRDYNDLMDTTARTMSNILQRLPDGTLVERTM